MEKDFQGKALKVVPYEERVAEFHRTFGAPIEQSPVIPPERSLLRLKLLQEELDELKDAIVVGDRTAVADALVDLQYVLSGAVLEFGLTNVFELLFQEVHESNMSKKVSPGPTLDTVLEEAVQRYGPHFQLASCPDGKGYYLRRTDGKILKPYTYHKAQVSYILDSLYPEK